MSVDGYELVQVNEAYRLQSVELGGRELFEFCLLCDGRIFEFRRLVEESVVEMGLDEEMAWDGVAKEMGYEGADRMRAWYLGFLEYASGEERRRRRADLEQRRRDRLKAESRAVEFEASLLELDAVADWEEEWDWIAGHRRMLRALEVEEGERDVEILAEDVLGVEMECPSKRAVAKLRKWVKTPEEFYKLDQSVQLKRKPKDGAEGSLEDEIFLDAKKTSQAIGEMIETLVRAE